MNKHEAASFPAWPAVLALLLRHAATWGAICAIGALGTYSDRLRAGDDVVYTFYLLRWLNYHVPMMLLSAALAVMLLRWPAVFDSARRSAAIYAALLLLFLPLELLYVAGADLFYKGVPLSWHGALLELDGMSKFGWFTEFAWMSGTLVAMAALGNRRLARTREQAWRGAQTDNLQLRLALEQQQMLALRAQLEPHFIFNALNAISALVRGGDKAVALSGIGRLSDLLRYALAAGAHDLVSIDEELQFVRDYLALQRMRHGERLRFVIEGDTALVRGGDCPPLLLQPLVENALRHDIDSHDGHGDIRLSFDLFGEQLRIRVCNPLNAHATPNPGAGLGLRNTRARLQLTTPAATLQTRSGDGRFVVEIHMPLHAAP